MTPQRQVHSFIMILPKLGALLMGLYEGTVWLSQKLPGLSFSLDLIVILSYHKWALLCFLNFFVEFYFQDGITIYFLKTPS